MDLADAPTFLRVDPADLSSREDSVVKQKSSWSLCIPGVMGSLSVHLARRHTPNDTISRHSQMNRDLVPVIDGISINSPMSPVLRRRSWSQSAHSHTDRLSRSAWPSRDLLSKGPPNRGSSSARGPSQHGHASAASPIKTCRSRRCKEDPRKLCTHPSPVPNQMHIGPAARLWIDTGSWLCCHLIGTPGFQIHPVGSSHDSPACRPLPSTRLLSHPQWCGVSPFALHHSFMFLLQCSTSVVPSACSILYHCTSAALDCLHEFYR